jgi:hypothetical protein
MKTIQPVNIWNNGQSKEGVILNAYAINVTLGQYATFWWGILDADQLQLAQGNLLMQGEDYTKWGANDAYAWEFVANSLNLTIVGDYVVPVPETSSQVVEPILEEAPTNSI